MLINNWREYRKHCDKHRLFISTLEIKIKQEYISGVWWKAHNINWDKNPKKNLKKQGPENKELPKEICKINTIPIYMSKADGDFVWIPVGMAWKVWL